MVKGSGSAAFGIVMACLLLLHSELSEATTYTVGNSDSNGWTYNVANWPKGKSFKAGDVLVFNYDPALHNVVVVNKRGYKNCTTPKNAKVYQTGNDQITLAQGNSYFICNFPGHCEAGMKIAVTAG
ncbi:basic blue protein-like [Pistacia vera]|uniref:basic blue protein-like n=1 Tax=Pistacia vera TaxID=55513 RepID=UPI0012638B30|nr:basic blue protein-like [Pistacia vera]XP_031277127.1 basic blue protein-like [Pistacia vera]